MLLPVKPGLNSSVALRGDNAFKHRCINSMNIPGLRVQLSQFRNSAIRLLSIFILTAQVATACSWDYPIWQIRSKTAEPLYRFVQDDKAGYIDRLGQVVIEPRFQTYGNHGDEFESGLLHLWEARYVDTTGKLVINRNYWSAWDFSEGLAAAMPEKPKRWGYIDRSGEFIISPRFDTYPKGYVSSFSEGLAMVEVAGKYGYINRTGEFAIQPRFLLGTDFHEGLAWVILKGPCAFYGAGPCPDFKILGLKGRRGGGPDCKFALINKSGSIIATGYDYVEDFSEGLAPVRVGKKWGYIDKTGRMMIAPKFETAEPFSDGLARISQGELFGYIDKSGSVVISPQFKRAEDFSDGLAAVGNWKADSRYGEFYYINKTGEQAIPEKFALASRFFKGLAHVALIGETTKTGGRRNQILKFAYIDTSGKKVFEYEGNR